MDMSEEQRCEFVEIDGERFICIRDVDKLPPFLMSVVSDSDHWLFIGSNGPFSAGRVDADHAVFPYQTADKIMRHPDTSGALTLIQIKREGKWVEWIPAQRHLFKHIYGTEVVFEEEDDTLRFRWSLTTCEPYGFVRRCRLENLTGEPLEVRYLDGWHHILTPHITQQTYGELSYLAAAYMRHEAHPQGLGVYTLNAAISDKAEASEALRAAAAWSAGHLNPTLLLCDRQVVDFRKGRDVTAETEIRGEMGAYLASVEATLDTELTWVNVIDTGLDHAALVQLQEELRDAPSLLARLDEAVAANRASLRKRIAAADGLQDTADVTASVHHFANVLFNCMRGGTFTDGYRFPSADFADFIQVRNKGVHAAHEGWFASLPAVLTLDELQAASDLRNDSQLSRLAREYLPLTFSRRHGDPSRPWNRFNIHLKNEHGDPIFAYQGNWRDIFQNWESLAQSYPLCLERMVATFLNASTADGYNPYRISRGGIDWEVPEPHNPWANIGYWGDHQIIYLLRLLEGWEKFEPGVLARKLHSREFAYAQVPYEIKDFEALADDPRSSIAFNWELHEALIARSREIGGDGKLLAGPDGQVQLVSLAEKLLVPVLVKLSNLVPGGGIWLNTQRPEWNDANNALAGWGLSMVTVCYLRRCLAFLDQVFGEAEVELTTPVATLLKDLTSILGRAKDASLDDDASRYSVMESLGRAGAAHRASVYSGEVQGAEAARPMDLIRAALPVVDATIRAARRDDGLYESYSMLRLESQTASVRKLSLMLEGQVAVLSSGALGLEETAALLDSLRASDLYREDQKSYILYPDRDLTPFLDRNTFEGPPPVQDRSLFSQDVRGKWHFQADLHSAGDVARRLEAVGASPEARRATLELWEQVFRHSEFTGRSGTMFMFEGLGSIYWHMIAKLLVAVQECWEVHQDPRLEAHYNEIRNGLGFRKAPEEYGAFPTDPYSHTPKHRGAQQPGMTGQVKEEILTRWGELGVKIEGGRLTIEPKLLSSGEFHREAHRFDYVAVDGSEEYWEMPPQSLGFTYCQVPVCCVLADTASVEVERADGTRSNELTEGDTAAILGRTGEVRRVTVFVVR